MRIAFEFDRHLKRGVWIAVIMIAANARAATQITIFSDGPIAPPAIPDTQVTVWDLSLPERIEATAPEFAYDPARPERTAQIAKAWFDSAEGRAFSRKMHEAYAYMPIMFKCQIAKIPAIAFNDCKYVIYGTNDLRRAIQDYDEFLKLGR